jgi:hypothetical protein
LFIVFVLCGSEKAEEGSTPKQVLYRRMVPGIIKTIAVTTLHIQNMPLSSFMHTNFLNQYKREAEKLLSKVHGYPPIQLRLRFFFK